MVDELVKSQDYRISILLLAEVIWCEIRLLRLFVPFCAFLRLFAAKSVVKE